MALRNKPVLSQWEEQYWDMYTDIAGSRQWTTAGPAEIPYHIKILWLNENGIFDQDDRDEYLTVIKSLDQAYLDHASEKLEKLNGN